MSRIKGITIELDGETKGLQKSLSDVNKRSADVAKELRQVERLLKFNPGNTELVAQKQKLLGDQVETTREKLNRLKDAEADVQAQFEKGDISEEQYRAFQREIAETESKLKHYEGQLEQTQSKMEKFGEAVGEAGEKVKDAGKKMTGAGKELSKKITAPLVGAAAIAIKVGSDFEAGMSKVAAVSQASGDDLEKLTDKAREMGAATSFSATEAAEGLEYMALAGWETEEMLGGIEPILHLAEAGALDLGRASDLVTDSMAALGLEVDDLDGYLDRVAQTAANSNTDIDALMEAMVVAGGTFDRFNVPLEEANSFLGILANRGTKGSEAGTALNAIMTRLGQSAGPAADALEEMGVNAYDADGKFRGMETVMKDVESAMSDMTDKEKSHYTQQIAGLNHGKSFTKMLQGLGDEYDDLKGDVEGADGALIEMRNTMKDNLQGHMEEMKSGLEEVGIIIYDNLKPAMEFLVELITKLAKWFQDLSPAIQNTIVVIAGIAAAIGPLLIVLGLMAQGLGSIMTVVPKLIALMPKLGAAFTFLTGPVGITIAIIAALIAIGILLYKNWDKIKEFSIKIWTAIANWFKSVWQWIKDIFASALGWLDSKTDGAFSKIINVIIKYMQLVWNNIKVVWDFIKNTFKNALNFVKALVTGDFKGMKKAVSDQMQNIKTTVKNIWNNIMDFFRGIDLWQVGKDIISGLMGGIGSMASALVGKAKDVVGGAITGAKKLLGIASPSKVFMKMGEQTGEGFELGMGRMGGRIRSASEKMTGSSIATKPKPIKGDNRLNQLLQATLEQNKLLMQLLNKDNNTYLDGDKISKKISGRMNNDLNNISDRQRAAFGGV